MIKRGEKAESLNRENGLREEDDDPKLEWGGGMCGEVEGGEERRGSGMSGGKGVERVGRSVLKETPHDTSTAALLSERRGPG